MVPRRSLGTALALMVWLGPGLACAPPQPVPLAAKQKRPSAIAVDAVNVYWVTEGNSGPEGTLMRMPRAGGAAALVASEFYFPQSLAIDSENAFVTTFGGSLAKVALAGGATEFLTMGGSPNAVALDATHVYWTDQVTDQSDGVVLKMPLSGGTPVTLASGQRVPRGIAVDGTSVYWVNDGNGLRGSVMKVPLEGGPLVELASNQDHPVSVVVDGTSAYWTSSGTSVYPGAVLKVPLSGGVPVVLASGQRDPTGLAVHHGSLFWTNGGTGNADDGKIMTVSTNGGTALTLATGQARPRAIAVDEATLYWVNFGDGTVMKLPR